METLLIRLSAKAGSVSEALTFEQIVARLLSGLGEAKTDWFQEFFECVEHELIYGNRAVQDALIVDLLEALKNQASLRDIDYAIFENWLGPETHIAWRWLEKKWRGKTSLADSASGRNN